VKDAVGTYPVLPFLALRFTLALVFLIPLLRPSRIAFTGRGDLAIGALIGVPMAVAYICQTQGLETAGAAEAGLLTGLFVLLTPVLDVLIYRAHIARATAVAAVAGLIGTALLTLSGEASFSVGDALEIVTAVGFALQIIFLSRYAKSRDPSTVTFGQMLCASVLFWLMVGATSAKVSIPTGSVMSALLITGILATAAAFWIQTWAQTKISAERTAITLLAEPVFATLFAVWLGSERLDAVQWVGALMIVITLASHEIYVNSRPADAR
jgi:drug/metabolite transporter (DMT)-like permease